MVLGKIAFLVMAASAPSARGNALRVQVKDTPRILTGCEPQPVTTFCNQPISGNFDNCFAYVSGTTTDLIVWKQTPRFNVQQHIDDTKNAINALSSVCTSKDAAIENGETQGYIVNGSVCDVNTASLLGLLSTTPSCVNITEVEYRAKLSSCSNLFAQASPPSARDNLALTATSLGDNCSAFAALSAEEIVSLSVQKEDCEVYENMVGMFSEIGRMSDTKPDAADAFSTLFVFILLGNVLFTIYTCLNSNYMSCSTHSKKPHVPISVD
ncbi:MAG: hypothetical protein VW397_00945 [Candidatus Margulisiibacteriota bacterium]